MTLSRIAVLATVLAAGGSAAVSSPGHPFSATVFEHLGATPVECPPVLLASIGANQRADCAATASKPKQFRKDWKRLLRDHRTPGFRAVGDWKRDDDGRWVRRLHLVGHQPMIAGFSEADGGLFLVYGNVIDACPGEEPDAAEALPFPGDDDVTNPVVIRATKTAPAYPVEARRDRVQGQAVLKVKIDRQGVPSVLCVLRETPERRGFAEAASAAVRQWRYEPATRNGEPIDVQIVVALDWSLQ